MATESMQHRLSGAAVHLDLGGSLGGQVAKGALRGQLDGRLLAGHRPGLASDHAVPAADGVLVCGALCAAQQAHQLISCFESSSSRR